MRQLSLAAAFLFATVASLAQDFEVPLNPSLKTPEDYVALEPTVLAAIDWLMKTPLQEQQEKRKDINEFMLKWLTRTKAVSMGIDSEILTFMDSSPDLLMIFMSGWIKYALETKEVDNQLAGNMHGMEAVIDYYTKYMQASKKDKNVEKYVKMKSEGTLAKYMEKHVKQ